MRHTSTIEGLRLDALGAPNPRACTGALLTLRQATRGLRALHRARITNRNVTPSPVLRVAAKVAQPHARRRLGA